MTCDFRKIRNMEPAQSVILKCGGIEKVAEICGVSVSRVYRWMRPKEKGGTDGLIPSWHQPKILAHAKANRLAIKPVDFFATSSPNTHAAE